MFYLKKLDKKYKINDYCLFIKGKRKRFKIQSCNKIKFPIKKPDQINIDDLNLNCALETYLPAFCFNLRHLISFRVKNSQLLLIL
jgi:hypothetical protein